MDIEKTAKYMDGVLNFHCNIFYHNQALELSEADVVYAATSLMALFFMFEKENIVEKGNIKGESGIQYSSKLFDQALEDAIDIIATKEENGYRIGTYYTSNAANIVSKIRNKLAHGSYDIDVENHKIIINFDGALVCLEIEQLMKFINSSIRALLGLSKSNKRTRILSIPPSQTKHIDNELDLRDALNSISTRLYSVNSGNKDFNVDDATIFDNTVKQLGICLKNNLQDLNHVYNEGVSYFKSKKMNFKYEERNLTEIQKEALLLKLKDNKDFYSANVCEQINLLLRTHEKIVFPNETHIYSLIGLYSLLEIALAMLNEKNYTIENLNISDKVSNLISGASIEMNVINLLSCFNAVYIFPFEETYGKNYLNGSTNSFDYSKFNFDLINPEIMDSFPSKYIDITNQYISCCKKKEELQVVREKAKQNYMTVKSNPDSVPQLITALHNKISNIDNIINEFAKSFNTIKIKYDEALNDYNNNKKYYKNFAIINGIRNSICHGNITIKAFDTNDYDEDIRIVFEDIYNDKTTFKLEITLIDFVQVFFSNSDHLYLFLQDKLDNLLTEKINTI